MCPKNNYYVYIAQSLKDKRYYIGSTEDLLRRLGEHNKGKTKSLRNKGPFEIIYSEKFDTRGEAYRRGIEIKSYKGGNVFKKLVK